MKEFGEMGTPGRGRKEWVVRAFLIRCDTEKGWWKKDEKI